jgi:hypothetical protein
MRRLIRCLARRRAARRPGYMGAIEKNPADPHRIDRGVL